MIREWKIIINLDVEGTRYIILYFIPLYYIPLYRSNIIVVYLCLLDIFIVVN